MKKLFALAAVLFVVFCGLTGCSSLKFENKAYTVEYGSTFTLPSPEGVDKYEVCVFDEQGNKVPLSYGSFRPQVGKYSAEYTSGGSKKTLSIQCADTTVPQIVIGEFVYFGKAGDTVSLPHVTVTDQSELKVQGITVTKQDGSVVDTAGNSFTPDSGVYALLIYAEDVYGNRNEIIKEYRAFDEYIDTGLSENVLYSFDNEQYLNLVTTASEDTTLSIVTEGYPKIENEQDSNGVLKMASAVNYGDVDAVFTNYMNIPASDTEKIIIRLSADKNTDYVRLIARNGEVVKTLHMLKENQWYQMEISPVDYGYGEPLSGFTLQFRSNRGVNIYIDSIEYLPMWKDLGKPTETVADFSESGYVNKMYQNVYNGTWMAGGSVFETVEYPKDTTKTVMKVSVTEDRGGFTFMFDERISLSDIETLTVTMDCALSPAHLWVGTMQGSYKRGSSYFSLAGWGADYQKLYAGQMHAYTIPKAQLEKMCADGYISGLWMSVINGSYSTNTLYLDSVTVEFKTT